MINVFLVDDHQLFLDGLKAILEIDQNIHIVGESSNGQTLIDLLEKPETNIDVVILDVEMPEINGIEVAKGIVGKYPKVKILIVSMYKKKNYILNLMDIGISGYILKNKSKENLINAIHQVHAGTNYFELEVLAEAVSRRKKESVSEPLTKREMEVLCRIGEGFKTKEIALQLGIGNTTVDTYRRNLLLKLNVSNDKHLVRYAIKMGYVEL